MIISTPISLPIAKLLDAIVGEEHSSLYKRSELKALVDLHSSPRPEKDDDRFLRNGEAFLLKSVLEMTNTTVLQAMTSLKDIFMLPESTILSEEVLASIVSSGFTKIPIYSGSRSNVKGILLVSQLVSGVQKTVPPQKISDLPLMVPIHCTESTSLYSLLKTFRAKNVSLGLVSREGNGSEDLLGLISLGDLFNYLLYNELLDEVSYRSTDDSENRPFLPKTSSAFKRKQSHPIHKTGYNRKKNDLEMI